MDEATSVLDKGSSASAARLQPASRTTGLPWYAFMNPPLKRTPDSWERTIKEIMALSRLGDDWDGLGALAPTAAVLDSATAVVKWHQANGSPEPTRVVAATDGGVIIEWQHDDFYADVEITKPYHARWMLRVKGRATQHGKLVPGDFQRMFERIGAR
jgi:hypothetical protein